MPRILIMTDSTCDLPAARVQQYDIRIVPTYVQFGTESLADDGVQLTRAGFYQRMVDAPIHPTTSAPPLGETHAIMAQALEDADHVIALTAPAALSGIYNTFRLSANNLGVERVTLIDSAQLSMGLGWQVLAAAEMAEAGATPVEIQQAIHDLQPHIDVWAALDTMQYLRRSGRVGWATAMVGELFQIKPIVHLRDSAVRSASRARTSRRAFDALVGFAQQAAPLARLAVMHTQNLDGAHRLLEALADIRPAGDVPIVEATPVIGVHVGPDALGLAVVQQT
jgi:DegV family protein with EDD domain